MGAGVEATIGSIGRGRIKAGTSSFETVPAESIPAGSFCWFEDNEPKFVEVCSEVEADDAVVGPI